MSFRLLSPELKEVRHLVLAVLAVSCIHNLIPKGLALRERISRWILVRLRKTERDQNRCAMFRDSVTLPSQDRPCRVSRNSRPCRYLKPWEVLAAYRSTLAFTPASPEIVDQLWAVWFFSFDQDDFVGTLRRYIVIISPTSNYFLGPWPIASMYIWYIC